MSTPPGKWPGPGPQISGRGQQRHGSDVVQPPCSKLGEISPTASCKDARALPRGYILQTFGLNGYGQLGTGRPLCLLTPQALMTGPLDMLRW